MELVNATNSPLKGKCFSGFEASVSLSPCASSLKALSSLCLYGKFGFSSDEDRCWALENGPWCIRGCSLVLQLFGPPTSWLYFNISGNGGKWCWSPFSPIRTLDFPPASSYYDVFTSAKAVSHCEASTVSPGIMQKLPRVSPAVGVEGKGQNTFWRPKPRPASRVLAIIASGNGVDASCPVEEKSPVVLPILEKTKPSDRVLNELLDSNDLDPVGLGHVEDIQFVGGPDMAREHMHLEKRIERSNINGPESNIVCGQEAQVLQD
uniref:Uncharacterized protein n=1 Tax=Cannabis sativa TaxID=3483 RepID=A0A803P6A1_CANSA